MIIFSHLNLIFTQLEFDPSVTDFKSLLDIFWSGHDPTVPAYSRHETHLTWMIWSWTCRQYMSAIFCHGEEQMRIAKESMKAAAQSNLKKEIQTVIQPAGPFYQAEEWVLIFYPSIFLSQLPPEVHPAEAWLSLDFHRALTRTKTRRKQPRGKT